MNEKICLICLENIEDIEKVIEYNHCGIYYIHNECLNNWNHNECIICRKKFIDIVENNSANNSGTNNSGTNNSGANNSGTNNSGTNNSGTNNSGTNSTNNNVTNINTSNESVSSASTVDIIDVMSNPHIRESHRCRTIICSMFIMFNFLFIGSYLLIDSFDNTGNITGKY